MPSAQSIFWNHFSEGSLLAVLQVGTMARLAAGAVSAGASEEAAKGAAKTAQWVAAYVKGNVQPMLAEVERFLGENGNFSGDKDKIGEGDVSRAVES